MTNIFSRGKAISAYLPAFSKGALIYGANIQSGVITSAHIADGTIVVGEIGAGAVTSAKIGVSAVTTTKIQVNAVRQAHISAQSVTSAKIRAVYLSGTIVSGQTTRAIAHGLGVRPKFVIVDALLTLAQGISAKVPTVRLAAASAATSTNFYVISNMAANLAVKYVAYVQL